MSVCLAVASHLHADQPAAVPGRAFEVASIKPNNSGSGSDTINTSRGRFTGVNVTVDSLIELAFGVRAFQISGGPGWLATDHYDIAATTGDSKELNDGEIRPYVESLLVDRLHLRYHREKKDASVYSLLPARTGVKLTAHEGEGDSSNNISVGSGKASITSTNVKMASFADLLSGRVDRVVIDHTGLSGGYDLKLTWAPDPGPESTEPSLFAALEEQLGLRLESTKGPVDIIVIDSMERPSEN